MKETFRITAVLAFLTIVSVSLAGEPNEFEGKYKVGSTFCTVKPIKMAFELRWAKGKGVLVFFFIGQSQDGKFTYATGSETNKSDRFIFDSSSLDAGVFVRADGKELPVTRVR